MNSSASVSTDRVAELAASLVAEHRLPSLSVAVAHAGRDEVDARSFGRADLAGVPATPETAYLLASTTKPIVATLAALLHERGVVDLAEPLADRLPWLLPPGRAGHPGNPTLQQALTHTAGFGTHYDFSYGDQTPASLPQTFARYGTLFRPPGTTYEYANLGYAAAGAFLEAATGLELRALLRRELFEPLWLSTADFGPVYDRPGETAVRYSEANLVAYPVIDTTHRAASLGWMSASDLARFGLAHSTSSALLDETTRRLVSTPGVESRPRQVGPPPGSDYGLGWHVCRVGDLEVLLHGGDMCGVGAMVTVVRTLGLSIAVTVNRTDSLTHARVMRDELLTAALPGWPPASGAPLQDPPLPAGRWSGAVTTYAGPVPLTLTVADDGATTVELGAAGPLPAVLAPPYDERPTAIELAVDHQLPTPDAMVQSPELELAFDEDHGVLRGAARALKTDEAGDRVGNCLSHWCELVPT